MSQAFQTALPGLFAARERRHRHQCLLTPEPKATQEVPQFLLGRAAVQLEQMLQGTPLGAQLFQLMLGKIAYCQALTLATPTA